MKFQSGAKETQVKKMVEVEVTSIEREREYTVTFTREEINLLRGLHFRLHNNPHRAVRDALNLYETGWAVTDGPAGETLYDDFLGKIWYATNPFNGEK